MKRIKRIVLSTIAAVSFASFPANLHAGFSDITGSIDEISGAVGAGSDALNGLINGVLGPDFYTNLDIGRDVFEKFGDYSKQLNQLLGVLGITGNINCFMKFDVDNIIKPISLDRICKLPVNDGGLDWSKQLSGKFEIPGIGSIGCEATAAFNPIASIDLCALAKKSFQVLRDPNDPTKGYLDGGGIIINPVRTIEESATTDTLLRTESNVIHVSAPDETYYKSGASVKSVNDALDVDTIFEEENNANSPIAEAISRDNPEEYELLKSYIKSSKAKDNAEDSQIGDGWDEHPTAKQISKEAVKARADYFGLPQTNQDVDTNIAGMSHLLAQEFPYTDFAKSLEVYLGVKYGEINENGSVVSVPQAKELETQAFNEFLEGNVQVESKTVIEGIDAHIFTAIEKVASSSGRLTAPTQQRLSKLPSNKKLAYVALANKQYTRDALIASIASRITQFKKRLFDLKVEKTRVCASRFYDNVADSELNKIINSADALVY